MKNAGTFCDFVCPPGGKPDPLPSLQPPSTSLPSPHLIPSSSTSLQPPLPLPSSHHLSSRRIWCRVSIGVLGKPSSLHQRRSTLLCTSILCAYVNIQYGIIITMSSWSIVLLWTFEFWAVLHLIISFREIGLNTNTSTRCIVESHTIHDHHPILILIL